MSSEELFVFRKQKMPYLCGVAAFRKRPGIKKIERRNIMDHRTFVDQVIKKVTEKTIFGDAIL